MFPSLQLAAQPDIPAGLYLILTQGHAAQSAEFDAGTTCHCGHVHSLYTHGSAIQEQLFLEYQCLLLCWRNGQHCIAYSKRSCPCSVAVHVRHCQCGYKQRTRRKTALQLLPAVRPHRTSGSPHAFISASIFHASTALLNIKRSPTYWSLYRNLIAMGKNSS